MAEMKNDKAILLSVVEGVPLFEVVKFVGGLDWYYEQIECECIDIVHTYGLEDMQVAGDNGSFCLIVDDESLLKANPIFNPYASLAYGIEEHGQGIFGKALVCQNFETPNGIETIGLTDYEVYKVQSALNKLVDLHNKRALEKMQEDKAE